jgi:predicted DCC family thiol-disulfide oxidoreductase YuxK
MARWVRRRAPAGRVLALPNQSTGALERYGVTREEADRAAWTIDSDGTRLEGAAALNRVLRAMGGGWSALAALYRLRPLRAAEEALYRWFVPRRFRFSRLGVTPECEEPGAGCA